VRVRGGEGDEKPKQTHGKPNSYEVIMTLEPKRIKKKKEKSSNKQ